MSRPPRVVVTRPSDGDDTLTQRLERLGIEVVAVPAIQIGPPRSYDALDTLARHPAWAAWICFMSRNAVRHYVQRRRRFGRRDVAPVPPTVDVAVVGPASAATARRAGIEVALESEGRTGADLAVELADRAAPGARIAVVQAQDGRPDVADALRLAGFEVETIAAYRTRSAQVPAGIVESIRASEVDALAFASPSSVVSFAIALEGLAHVPRSVIVGAIGPTTAHACERAGRPADVVAPSSSGEALADAVVEALAAGVHDA